MFLKSIPGISFLTHIRDICFGGGRGVWHKKFLSGGGGGD